MSKGLDPDQDQCSFGPDLGQTVCKGCEQTKKVTAIAGKEFMYVQRVQKDEKIFLNSGF